SAAVILALLIGGSSVLLEPGIREPGELLLFALIAVAAEWFAESIYGRANSSWAAVPLVALAMLEGSTPTALVLAAAATAVGGGVLRGLRGRQMLFNGAVLMLATLAAGASAQQVVAVVGGPELLAFFLGGLVGGTAFFAIDTWLVATAVGLVTGSSAFDVWREDLAWLVPHQVGMGVLGGIMGYAHLTLDVTGTLVLILPALGLHFAQRQFVSRTRDHVVRLRTLNDDLQHANRRVGKVNERLTDALEQVNNGYLVTVESLASAVDAKDSYTGSHIDRVEAFGRRLLEVLDPELSHDEALLWGFRLHDVGKIGVPDSVLLKPGPLDDHEWEIMKRHPEIGAQIVQAAPFLQGARDVILHHHERWDGRGYPFGLRGSAIPFSARVFGCIDAFDAMTSDRPYRKAMPVDRAMQELLRHAGTQFDPEVIEAFVQIEAEELERARVEVQQARGARRARAGGLLIPIASETFEAVGQG
ncbi:MAG TPA: HD domain-containing phosphohydrolase, partial [Nitriliruptorales bacterium]